MKDAGSNYSATDPASATDYRYAVAGRLPHVDIRGECQRRQPYGRHVPSDGA
jgi:hypothetical protein